MVTPGEPHRRLVVAGVMASMFLAAMESTVVATAMPTVIAMTPNIGNIQYFQPRGATCEKDSGPEISTRFFSSGS